MAQQRGNEAELNMPAYALLFSDRVDDAATIMKLNSKEDPHSATVHASYGDALARAVTARAWTLVPEKWWDFSQREYSRTKL